jgi:hypothetical protein
MENFNKLTDVILDLFCYAKNNISVEKMQKQDIKSKDIFQVVHNIKSIIELLISENIELDKENSKKELNFEQYEDIIKKLESDIRSHIKVKN